MAPEEFLVRFDHAAELGGARTAEGADDLLAVSHVVATGSRPVANARWSSCRERPAQSATRTAMIAEHVGDHLMKAGRRMDAGKGRAGR